MKKLIMLFMAVLMLATCAIPTSTAYADEELIIVLDPGHDSKHAGAGGNGVREEKAVLKIGLYLREELNKYENVKVYMVREGEACAFPETHSMSESSKRCNEARVAYAESVGADVIVSLHLNSFASGNPSGVLAFVQNNNFDANAGSISQNLGRSIVNSIAELGLANGGIVAKGSDWDTKPEEYYYEDGSIADYYRVLRYAKKVHIPAVIVEHAFLSNASDVAKVLSSEEGLKSLALKDAEGIVEYYGLTLKEGCVAGELPDISSIPGTQSKPTLITQPEPTPQPTPDPETESEVETEEETEVVTESEEETEIEVIPEKTETEVMPEETETEMVPVEGEPKEFPWGGALLFAGLFIAGGIGGFAGVRYYLKKQSALHKKDEE